MSLPRSTPTRRTARAAALALCCWFAIVAAGGTAGAAPEGGVFQPDLRVSANGTTFVGNDVYNGGRSQAVVRRAAPRTTASFRVGLQIDPPVSPEDISDITLTGCGAGNSHFRVRYYLSTSPRVDVTSDVLDGGYVVDTSISGADVILTEPLAMPFEVAIKVKPAAPAEAEFSCKLRAETLSAADTVKVTVRRR